MARLEATGLVLKVTPYRETSALVTLFTRQLGRLVCVAKGYRGRSGRAVIAPFTIASVSLVGRGDLKTLSNFDPIDQVALDGDRLPAGFYVLELVTRALYEHQVEAEIYDATVATLAALNENLAYPLRRFERFLLESLGYGFDCAVDGQNEQSVEDEQFYRYQEEVGMLPCPAEVDAAIPGWALKQIALNELVEPQVLRWARLLYQQALVPLIGPEPINSRALLRATS